MDSPKVSILIPVYNRENFIASCIESALSQTFTDLEVIVVDNASTDRTWDICQHYAGIDSRVRIFRNEENIGPVRNWLACVAQATGEYTKILWSDDLIAPEFLSKLLPYLDDPSVGFVYSSVDVFEKVKEIVSNKLFSKIESGFHDSKKYIVGALLGNDFPCSPGCAIFRTTDIKKNLLLHVPNRINSDFSMHAIGNDLLLFLLTAQQYPKFAIVNQPLSFFRSHKDSITTSAPPGRLPLHYDLAKGFFSEKFISDTSLLKKLNSKFLIDQFRYRLVARNLGIRSLVDFYPSNTFIDLDAIFLLSRIKRFIADKF
ncbi:MAG: glycosyltransferase family 2 protein [Gallionella sp.]|nr:glycosyltransferase family 2 protein [Gallionella sp.]